MTDLLLGIIILLLILQWPEQGNWKFAATVHRIRRVLSWPWRWRGD